MKRPEKNASKELYKQLRALPWPRLWGEEVVRFDKSTAEVRSRRAAVVRAVGVVFSESGDRARQQEVSRWLIGLLQDPCEKIRRYAMAALPKIGAGTAEEAEVLALLQQTGIEREKNFAARALEKIGGTATLKTAQAAHHLFSQQTEQKVKASLARLHRPSALQMSGLLRDFDGLRIHLRGRRGLEGFVREETEDLIRRHGKFRLAEVGPGLVALTPVAPFALADLYALRCFGTVGFVPGGVGVSNSARSEEALASIIASPLSRQVLGAFTEGTIRYRLNFADKGHQRAAVRNLAARVYALCPEILNDARDVTWTVDIFDGPRGKTIEWRPNVTPDPRFSYRRMDVPAASHPPLAACLARLAGRVENEIVWDPFCGSGLELIERALLGGVRAVHGTDLSALAIEATRQNFAAAGVNTTSANFVCADFQTYAAGANFGSEGATLIITNPPMGNRVPVADLRGLIEGLFRVAARTLRPGGRLVLANPLSVSPPDHLLQLQFRQVVDFGGFDCQVEKYLKPTK